MNDPIDVLLEHGWKIQEKDVYGNTGDTIYTLYHEDNPTRKFKIIVVED